MPRRVGDRGSIGTSTLRELGTVEIDTTLVVTQSANSSPILVLNRSIVRLVPPAADTDGDSHLRQISSLTVRTCLPTFRRADEPDLSGCAAVHLVPMPRSTPTRHRYKRCSGDEAVFRHGLCPGPSHPASKVLERRPACNRIHECSVLHQPLWTCAPGRHASLDGRSLAMGSGKMTSIRFMPLMWDPIPDPSIGLGLLPPNRPGLVSLFSAPCRSPSQSPETIPDHSNQRANG